AVREGDKAAVLLHIRGEEPRGFYFVEILRAEARDAVECAAELGLKEGIARFVEFAVAQENAIGFGELAKAARGSPKAVRLAVGEDEAFGGEVDGGADELGPRLLAE